LAESLHIVVGLDMGGDVLVEIPPLAVSLIHHLPELLGDLHTQGQSPGATEELVMEGSVTGPSILGLLGHPNMHPDGGVMKEVVKDLPYLLHVNREVDVEGSNSFGLMQNRHEGVASDRGSSNHFLVIRGVS
jgi:hypothetical protein